MSLLEELAGALGGGPAAAGQGRDAAILAAVLAMVQSHPGGVAGIIQAFEQAGLGGVVSSWVGPGPNQAVAPAQAQQALGVGPIAQVASQLGVSQDEAAGHVSRLLPQIIDHLTPRGTAPPDGGLGAIAGLLGKLGV